MNMMKYTRSSNVILFCLTLLFGLIRFSDQTVYTCDPSASCGCSKNSAVVTKIVGGEAANTASWGWAVSININNAYLCGGSIISSSWVVTAAHCVANYVTSPITIYAGSNMKLTGSQSRKVSHAIVHPDYDSTAYTNDIALLLLESPLDMTDASVSTICLTFVNSTTLATEEWPSVNTPVVAVGWGRLTEGGSISETLQQVTVQIVDHEASTCTPVMSNWAVQLCAGVSGGGKDACQGDSGGPLMMFSSNNQWVLVGITSSGAGCARPEYSGIYTRVAAFGDWINITKSANYTTSGGLSMNNIRTPMNYFSFVILLITIIILHV